MNIHEGHSWGGDDYALYLKEAENISKGIPFYKTGFIFYDRNICFSPPQYPPGFPLLLAPIVKIWGLSIKPMCYYNTVLVVLFMLAAFAWLRNKCGAVASLCVTLLMGYSWYIIDIKQSIWSDIPCLLFTMLYLLLRDSKRFPVWRLALLILCGSMAILIRTQAILLIFAEMIYLSYSLALSAYRRKPIDKRLLIHQIATIAGVILFVMFVGKYIFPTPASTAGFYFNYLRDVAKTGLASIFRNNVNFFIQTIENFFFYETDSGFRTAMVTIMQSSGLVLTLTGLFISIRERLKFEDIFFCLVVIMMLYYPIHDSRYMLPAIAVIYYYCYAALRRILPAVTRFDSRKIAVGMTCFCLFAGLKYLKASTHPPVGYVPASNDNKALAYIRNNISDTDIVLFSRPRFLNLYTNKKSMVQAWLLPMETNRKIFDSLNVKYALVVNGLADDFYRQYFREIQKPIDSISIADGYTLYRLR